MEEDVGCCWGVGSGCTVAVSSGGGGGGVGDGGGGVGFGFFQSGRVSVMRESIFLRFAFFLCFVHGAYPGGGGSSLFINLINGSWKSFSQPSSSASSRDFSPISFEIREHTV